MDEVALKQEGSTIFISGPLTVDTVEGALTQIKPLITYDDKMIIDLDQATSCDSASLAFLIAILKEAKLKRSKIVFTKVSHQLLDLSRVSGVDGLITIEN